MVASVLPSPSITLLNLLTVPILRAAPSSIILFNILGYIKKVKVSGIRYLFFRSKIIERVYLGIDLKDFESVTQPMSLYLDEQAKTYFWFETFLGLF